MVKGHLQERAFCCLIRANTVLQLFRATCEEGCTLSQIISTAHRVDWAESGEVVFEGCVVAMPGDHIEGGEVLLGLKDPPT